VTVEESAKNATPASTESVQDPPSQLATAEPVQVASSQPVDTESRQNASPQPAPANPVEPTTPTESIQAVLECAPAEGPKLPAEPSPAATPPPPDGRFRRLSMRACRWAVSKPRLKLSADDLHDRLELKSIGIIEELHALALRRIDAEEQRESRLDGKAQGLLVSASLTLTVAFTFGGLLLQHPDYLDPLRDFEFLGLSAAWAVVACYSFALVCGLAASYVSIRALYVRADYQGVDEQAVLGKAILDVADAQPGEGARAAFRRYAAAHYWQIAQHNSDIHDVKADRIKLGQRLFIGFLACLMLIGLGLGYSAYAKLQLPPANQEVHPMSDQKPQQPTTQPMPSSPPASPSGPANVRPLRIPIAPAGAPLKKSDNPGQ
jgi:hypothetical protein